MRTVGLFILTLQLLWANELNHMRHGALVGKKGQIFLLEEHVWVTSKIGELYDIPRKLIDITERLSSTLEHLSTHDTTRDHLKSLIIDKIHRFNLTLHSAIQEYDIGQQDRIKRVKRGFFDGLGYLSRSLFGTAVDKDVKDLRQKFQSLTNWATENNKVIEIVNKNMMTLHKNIEEIQNYTTTLTVTINKLFVRTDELTAMTEVIITLSTLETYLNTLVIQNKDMLESLINAGQGKITGSTLPLLDLKYILRKAEKELALKPLFEEKELMYYYTVMSSFVSKDSIVINIPFESKHNYFVYELQPFPMIVNNSIFILDKPTSMILTDKDHTTYTSVDKQILNECHNAHLAMYFCPASLFAFIPVRETEICDLSLLLKNSTLSLELCPYKEIPPNDFYHVMFFNMHYFLFPKPTQITVRCTEGSSYKRVHGPLMIRKDCSLSSIHVTSISETSHIEKLPQRDNLIFELNLNGSNINYVTNKLHTLYLANISKFKGAVVKHLPKYLQPSTHYPMVTTPIVITLILILIVIPVIFLHRRGIRDLRTVYSFIREKSFRRSRRPNHEPNQEPNQESNPNQNAELNEVQVIAEVDE